MFFQFRNQLARAFHDRGCRCILNTPPLLTRRAPLVFCSMVSQRDFIMYLVAIKSVYSRLGEGSVCIINDGSLDAGSIDLLGHHLDAPIIINIAEIGTGQCPRGGTWERLLHILDLSKESYVIQVDSDILARASIPEVLECYRQNRSFTLGSWAGRDFAPMTEAAAYAQTLESQHVQVIAECAFGRLEGANRRHYVRGSSGFAGFAKGGASRQLASEFSAEMTGVLGNRWSEWGSEQVTSCYVVANTAGARVLPWPKYTNFSPHIDVESAALLHFVGDYRFYQGRYRRESQRFISEIGSA